MSYYNYEDEEEKREKRTRNILTVLLIAGLVTLGAQGIYNHFNPKDDKQLESIDNVDEDVALEEEELAESKESVKDEKDLKNSKNEQVITTTEAETTTEREEETTTEEESKMTREEFTGVSSDEIGNLLDEYEEDSKKNTTANETSVASNELTEEVSETVDSVVSSIPLPEEPLTEPETPSIDEFDNYYQGDYYDVDYGYGTSVATAGCGPTAVAMVLSFLTGEDIDPAVTAKYSLDNGYRVKGVGTDWELFKSIANQYDIECEQLGTNKDRFVQDLQDGKVYILSMRPGHFTSEGHFIVIVGLNDDGTVIVADPASRERSATTWDVDTVMSETKQMWVFGNMLKEYSEEDKHKIEYRSMMLADFYEKTGAHTPTYGVYSEEAMSRIIQIMNGNYKVSDMAEAKKCIDDVMDYYASTLNSELYIDKVNDYVYGKDDEIIGMDYNLDLTDIILEDNNYKAYVLIDYLDDVHKSILSLKSKEEIKLLCDGFFNCLANLAYGDGFIIDGEKYTINDLKGNDNYALGSILEQCVFDLSPFANGMDDIAYIDKQGNRATIDVESLISTFKYNGTYIKDWQKGLMSSMTK